MLKTALKVLVGAVALVVIAALGFFLWASHAASTRLAQRFETHRVDVPIPFPLDEQEIAQLRKERAAVMPAAPPAPAPTPAAPALAPAAAAPVPAPGVAVPPDPLVGVDLGAIALKRAIARGEHLVLARYACVECHGSDFGGGTMVDAFPIGTILGVNITSGRGGQVANYTAVDWDRIVRHGVLPDGRPAAMPSEDFFGMSDRELSDVVAYVRSRPPVDKEVPRPKLGPLGTVLIATGAIPLSAERHKDHQAAHRVEPPAPAVTPEFGSHLLLACAGCHGEKFVGGPVVGGDPSWPPAANLTPHAEGLAGWTYDDFVRALRDAKSKDGKALRPPMSAMASYAKNLTEVELKAMWTALRALPPLPSKH